MIWAICRTACCQGASCGGPAICGSVVRQPADGYDLLGVQLSKVGGGQFFMRLSSGSQMSGDLLSGYQELMLEL